MVSSKHTTTVASIYVLRFGRSCCWFQVTCLNPNPCICTPAHLQEGVVDLDVPLVLVVLVQAILELGGPEREGLFRFVVTNHPNIEAPAGQLTIAHRWCPPFFFFCLARVSGTKSQMDEVKTGLMQGDYNIPTTSPHNVAGLLKEWLQSLPSPLIPTELEYAISLPLSLV